jgi:PAS domain S-box-containing protein
VFKRKKPLNKTDTSFEADARLAAVVNSIDDAYYVLDRDWRFVLLNDAAEAFLGAPRDQILGQTIWDFYLTGKQSRFAPLLERAMAEGLPGRLTGPSQLWPGRFVDFRVKPLGADGLGVSIVDVTARTLAEQAMQESRERLDLAVAAHRIGIFDWHVPSDRVVWSPELEAIFGLEPGAFEGTPEAFQSRVLAEDFARAQADTEAALRDGRDLIPFNFRIRRPDGAIRWIEGVSRVVYGADKTPKRIVGTNFDVTERFLAEQAIHASRERLDLAVGAHNIGIFDLDVASGRVLWNQELEVIFGLPPGGFEGHFDDFRRRALAEDLDELQAKTDAALAEHRDVVDYAYRILRPDGETRWLEGRARVVYGCDGGPERVVGTIMDVTERKAAEQHQRLLVNELNHRVKNTLAIVQAITWQSFRSGGMTLRAREAFEGRLAALAAAHDVITRQNWEAGSIDRIIQGAVAPHDPGDGRLTVGGPPVALEPKSAVALALAMHELATNAVKYGALSTPDGRVDVRWTADRGFLRLTWCESGGPPVVGPIERGFGARLLERGLAEDLHGEVRLEFRPTGVHCAVEAQLAA